jgi:microcompartment protein CcmL/EutN
MKTHNKIATSKLVARFDEELLNILREDLKAFKANNQFITNNKQATAQRNLKAA